MIKEKQTHTKKKKNNNNKKLDDKRETNTNFTLSQRPISGGRGPVILLFS